MGANSNSQISAIKVIMMNPIYQKSETNLIIILRCDKAPNQKFWNSEIKDWTSDIEEATIYPVYGDALRGIWKEIP